VQRRGRCGVPARLGRVAAEVIARECEPPVADAYERTCAALGATVTVDMEPFFAAGRLLYGPFVAARVDAFGAFVAQRPDVVEPVVASIVNGARSITGAEVFAAYAAVELLAAEAAAHWADVDALVVPTMPFFPTLADVAADPIGCNGRLGRFTDFVNLLDCCAIAVPGATRTDGLPFGISIIGPAGSDAVVAGIAAGADEPCSGVGGPARVAVVGAHLDGLPLHHELTRLSARLVSVTETAPAYRLYALPGAVPPKPGLVRAEPGAPIACEVYALGAREFAGFVAGVSAPLAIGPVELANGTWIPGFLAAGDAAAGGADVTGYGGWRAYLMEGMLT
jgi:allophanate hydrolase